MSLRAWSSGGGRVVAGRCEVLPGPGGGTGRARPVLDLRRAVEVVLRETAAGDGGAPGPERYAAGLRGHPHVLPVHDVVRDGGRRWAVTDRMAGAVHLRDLVARDGPLAPAECARIGLALLDALAFGHARGLVHGDVRAENVLLAPDATGAPRAGPAGGRRDGRPGGGAGAGPRRDGGRARAAAGGRPSHPGRRPSRAGPHAAPRGDGP
ncbi:protein kinase domain-containing protein [Streptomyces sp. enrichment culture]|uniref:protein kinase domain-containing protein n=1 Tax=Streptomyces sp. enrichment culture TaxID=1795815 RepID=UPI003F5650C7